MRSTCLLYTSTISGINDDLTDLAIQTDANLLESKAEDAYRQLEQYWKNLEWNYQKERDAVEDARYEKEWALKLAQQAASGSKSSSSSRSSSSRSSSSSKTSSSSSSSGGFDLSSLSNLESYVDVYKRQFLVSSVISEALSTLIRSFSRSLSTFVFISSSPGIKTL